jgi:hypothetical protein
MRLQEKRRKEKSASCPFSVDKTAKKRLRLAPGITFDRENP